MAFHFALKTLLKHRKRLEDDAQAEYLEAQNRVNEALNTIQQMYTRIEEIREKNMDLERGSSPGKLSYIATNNEFIDGQKIRIERKRHETRELMQIAEAKHEKLVEAAREYKILEKLREKKYSAYLKEQKIKEQKQMDDVVTMKFKRGSI